MYCVNGHRISHTSRAHHAAGELRAERRSPQQWAFVGHRELRRDLMQAVYRVYARLDLRAQGGREGEGGPTSAFLTRLHQEQQLTSEWRHRR